METIKNILVPIDFSDVAKNALQYAIEITKKTKANLIVLHVYYVPDITGSKPYLSSPDLILNTKELITQKLNTLVEEIPGLNQVDHEFESIPGYTAAEISIYAKNKNIDLIVMGTTGVSGIKEILIGTNTASIIQEAICPVLAIPEKARFRDIKTIAFAYDSDTISVPLKYKFLLTFAQIFNAEIEIFHVKTPTYDKVEAEQMVREMPSDNLCTVKQIFTTYYDVDVEQGINKYIEEKNIDILAMMPQKHTLFHNLFKGSLTKKMAFHSKIPLLAIPE